MKIRHLIKQKGIFYYKTTPLMRRLGFRSESLGANRIVAESRANKINVEWDEIKKLKEIFEVQKGDFDWLINEFQKDPVWYGDLAKITKDEADREFKLISYKIGPAKVRAMKVAHCRAFYNEMRVSCSIHKANKCYKWLNRILNYAIERGLVEYNVASGLKRTSTAGRSQTYSPEEIQLVINTCLNPGKDAQGSFIPSRKSIALATSIAYDTSLPRQDILALKWYQFDGSGFTVDQIKRRGRFTIYTALRQSTINLLTETNVVQINKNAHIIINEMTKQPWNEKLFSKAYLKFTRRAGLEGRTFHDIRRTALSEMGNTGATNAEIVSFSGHNIASETISDYVKPNKDASKRAFIKRFPNENKK